MTNFEYIEPNFCVVTERGKNIVLVAGENEALCRIYKYTDEPVKVYTNRNEFCVTVDDDKHYCVFTTCSEVTIS